MQVIWLSVWVTDFKIAGFCSSLIKLNNKKVLQRDRKRNITRCVASSHFAVLGRGYPILSLPRGTPSYPGWGYLILPWLAGGTQSFSGQVGGKSSCPGVPLPHLRLGYPHHGLGYPPLGTEAPHLGLGYVLSETGILPWKGHGTSGTIMG